jgi:hypothetical protein
MTLSELMAGKKLGETKVRQERWTDDEYFIPYYMDKDGNWFGLDDEGDHFEELGFVDEWQLYTGPKQKVVRWLWVCKCADDSWFQHEVFLTEQEARLEKEVLGLDLFKLNYTQTEFEDD